LQKTDYEGPVVTDEADDAQESENHCTVEQISAMVKAGLTEEQIKAACSKVD
jgi:Holliday junction resolvasome RuvABC DNA-binding subunit